MTKRRPPTLPALATTLLLGLLAGTARGGGGGEDDWLRPIGGGKVAAPQRIQGGESFAPLPLPATPLRRTERKRPPAPPLLVGKVVWGAGADFAFEDGSKLRVEDWNMCPADAQQLLKGAAKVLGVEYRADTVRLSSFDPDPLRTPVLYVSGGRRLVISGDQEAVIRRFVMAGGMVWFDAIAGSPYFTESVRALCGRLFPEEPLRELPPQHPIYHMAADAVKATLPPARGHRPPAARRRVRRLSRRRRAVQVRHGRRLGQRRARADPGRDLLRPEGGEGAGAEPRLLRARLRGARAQPRAPRAVRRGRREARDRRVRLRAGAPRRRVEHRSGRPGQPAEGAGRAHEREGDAAPPHGRAGPRRPDGPVVPLRQRPRRVLVLRRGRRRAQGVRRARRDDPVRRLSRASRPSRATSGARSGGSCR